MTDKDKTTIDIDQQGQRSEDDMDTDEEPPATATMLPPSQQSEPSSTQREILRFAF